MAKRMNYLVRGWAYSTKKKDYYVFFEQITDTKSQANKLLKKWLRGKQFSKSGFGVLTKRKGKIKDLRK